MSSNKKLSPLAYALRGAVLALVAGVAPLAQAAPTIWAGPMISYTQPAPDPTQAANQDRITPHVWLTRSSIQGLFNAFLESSYSSFAPTDTEWAIGTIDNYASLSYGTWAAAGSGRPVMNLVGQSTVLHLISDNIYLSVTFTALGGHGAGGFAYMRSTPGSPPPRPTVSITRPADGALFGTPGGIRIEAAALVSTGSVDNVEFLVDGNSVGSAQNPPFSITTGDLDVGDHSLTAVATAAGVSITSAMVSISVISPVDISLTTPTISKGQFSFSYAADPGLTYVVQNSSNMVDWLPVSTNVASSNPAQFTDGVVSNSFRHYRVGRLP